MGLFEKICNKIWPKFQTYYNMIDAWDYSPETKAILTEVWLKLSPVVKAAIMGLVTKMIAEYGPDKGKAIFDGVMEKIGGVVKDIA